MKLDYTLYLVTDRGLMTAPTLAEAVEQAILGGCTMIQLREKECSSLDFYRRAVEVKAVTDRYQIPLIINDRVDVALAVGAAGVHLGQRDFPAAAARRVLGPGMGLGVSAASAGEAAGARADGADYVGVGAVFPTGTKADADQVTLAELKRIRQRVDIPIVAIGGVTRGNVGLLGRCGVDGLAVVSAVLAQPDIRRAAAELRAAFRGV